jgi:hypothetical protein
MTFAERAKLPIRKKDSVELLNDYASSLPDAERDALLLMLSDTDTFSTRFVTDAIKAEGYPISRETVAGWRRAHRGL